ncbi:hemerythrin domain-containing protein [Aquabacterium sp.]|uniref:hemerythrin domain-containing protein n=1 Tax=Aquabacterium sp. TaxID=1872578 RepID=UPI002E2EBD93|nr:hemerythrin domain-containing protein [Aquabacterium sp.]HEX5313016.1 hemerythrin domain-containing protein [Aquabacterium sp.]
MPLVWSEAMSLEMPAMDEAHEDIVDQLALVETASDDNLLDAWNALIDETAEHFAEEDRWMQATGFAPDNCHSSQHAIVLKIMREGAEKCAKGDLAIVRQMAYELTVWLPHHVSAMDAGLALHLKSVGFNPETGQVDKPEALPTTALTSCRSEPCEDHAD